MMNDFLNKNIGAILDSDSNIMREIHKKVHQHKALERLLAAYIDPSLLAHGTLTSYENGQLVIRVDNAAWATVWRYTTPTLLEELKKEPAFKELTDIQAKVAAPTAAPAVVPLPVARPLSAETAALLLDTAETIRNPALQAALRKCAKIKLRHFN